MTRILQTPNGTKGPYNLGSGKVTTINELARILQLLLGNGEFRPSYASARPGDIRHSQADIGKARREFGFEPLTRLEDGFEKLVSEANLGLALAPHQTDVRTRVGNAEQY